MNSLKVLIFSSLSIIALAANSVIATPNTGSTGFVQTNNHTFKRVKLKEISPRLMKQSVERIKKSKSTERVMQSMELYTVTPFPSSVQLGMSGVPVLDQGGFGGCETFAATALLDALYAHGDYISQTCYLQMSGLWNHGKVGIFKDFKNNGVFSKQYETNVGCGGLRHYPSTVDDNWPSESSLMVFSRSLESETNYKRNSEKLFSNLTFKMSDIFSVMIYPENGSLLTITKRALVNGHRLEIEMIFMHPRKDAVHMHSIGLYGHYHADMNRNDSWVFSNDVQKMYDDIQNMAADVPYVSGHAMVITGYDDNAVIVDEQGKKHQGVLTLRSSWGPDVGDHGDFYMSYDYFESKAMVISVEEVYLNNTN